MDPIARVHGTLRRRLADGDLPDVSMRAPGSTRACRKIFQAQVLARALDIVSREMQALGQGFYTIGSSGHEGMAAVAAALRPSDPAFLHYRDAAFQIARARQAGHEWDRIATGFLKSFACAVDDPVSGGRHKVLGAADLAIPPQTSTIASHLPKAVGAAHAIGLMRRVPPRAPAWDASAIAVASFGDGSLNHSTAQGALNAAGWAAVQGGAMPVLFVCEDNGIGISVRSPDGWVRSVLSSRPGLACFSADGCDMRESRSAADAAAKFVRDRRRPAVLHLSLVRLYGHAGADVAEAYLSDDEIAATEARDPLLVSAALLRASGDMTPAEALSQYDATLDRVRSLASAAPEWRRLQGPGEVAGALLPRRGRCRAGPTPARTPGRNAVATEWPGGDTPQPMNRQINRALADLLAAHPEMVVFGEDVGVKGGVYGVTRGLQARFGRARVFDTLLDEQTILGLAIGLAQAGYLPIPEIQFLAYLHNAEDQLRGEAATLPFFSNGTLANPMVVRVPGLGYQKGFGGHFHNDNSLGVLRDIPGLIVVCPSRGDEAALLLQEAVRLAREDGRVVVFLEPIALYPARDVARDDHQWLAAYPPPEARLPAGEVGVSGAGTDLAIVTYGNGRLLSERAAMALRKDGVAVRIVDLRWLAPLPEDTLVPAVRGCAAVLVVDECRRSGNVSEGVMTLLAEAGLRRIARVTATDCFIATGPAHAATLPSVDSIAAAARALLSAGPDAGSS